MNRALPPSPSPPRRSVRLWVVLAVVAVFLAIALSQVLDPYGDADFAEVTHGNHSHFVPKDRDPDVEISRFPTTPPRANERITPQGQIVPR